MITNPALATLRLLSAFKINKKIKDREIVNEIKRFLKKIFAVKITVKNKGIKNPAIWAISAFVRESG